MLGQPKGEPTFQHIKNPLCEIKDCMGAVHRDNLCIFHLAERSAERQKQRDINTERSAHRRRGKDYPKEQMRGQYQSANRACSVCGKSGLHFVREKGKDRRPIRPNSYWEVLECVCFDCKEAGR